MTSILGVTPEPLYYISAIAGLVMVVGGIWLIFKEKIYIDRETKTVTEIETPFGFKFKTNIPALIIFVMGLLALFYPIVKSAPGIAEVRFQGEVNSQIFPKSETPIAVYAVVVSDTIRNPRSFNLRVPFLGNDYEYKVLYVVGEALQEEPVLLKANQNEYPVTVPDFSQVRTTAYAPGRVAERPAGF